MLHRHLCPTEDPLEVLRRIVSGPVCNDGDEICEVIEVPAAGVTAIGPLEPPKIRGSNRSRW